MKYFRYLLAALIVIAFSGLLHAEEQESKPFVATVGSDGAQKVDITAGGYWFKPNRITVRANVPVELTVSKESGVIPHDIVMKSPEAGMDFAEGLSGTPKVIKFTPTKPGIYPFYCSKKPPFGKSHKERGMEGAIEVVP
jgi:plastocyanin domain-containing protein